MVTEIQSSPTYPCRLSVSARWRHFCEQWRHCYLLLSAAFAVIWRVSSLPIPNLRNTRIMGGLHPLDVLLLMDLLQLMWVGHGLGHIGSKLGVHLDIADVQFVGAQLEGFFQNDVHIGRFALGLFLPRKRQQGMLSGISRHRM